MVLVFIATTLGSVPLIKAVSLSRRYDPDLGNIGFENPTTIPFHMWIYPTMWYSIVLDVLFRGASYNYY